MQNKKEVELGSHEWALIDYKIQTITGKSSLKILSLHRYSHTQDEPQNFTTEAAIQVTDLDRDYIERVVRRSMPARQMVFCCGHINIHPLAKPNKEFCFLLCKINLGRIDTGTQDNVLADSVLIQSQIQKDAFQYNFLLKDINHYRVEYQVRFTLGTEKEFAENDFECMNCQNKRAKVYCINENIQLCDDCSKEHHTRRIMSNHQLQKLDKVNSLPLCKKHSQKYKHYCLKCEKYLCDNCLQKGSTHGSNQHPVAEINALYEEKHGQNDTITARLKEKVENIGRNIEVKREQVEQNYKQTKQFIDQIYENALRTLNQLFTERIFLLKSEEIELRMTNDRLEWCRTFIKFQQKNLKPNYYFQSQQKFEVDMQQLKLNDLQTILSVKSDIAAQGQIIVASKQELDRNTKKALNSSRAELDKQSSRLQPDRVPEYTKPGLRSKQRTIYDYDSKAQNPIVGELGLMLQNAKLNFFCVGSQNGV